MDFAERNQYLAAEWRTSLTQEKREDYNYCASSKDAVPGKNVIKRTLNRIKREVSFQKATINDKL